MGDESNYPRPFLYMKPFICKHHQTLGNKIGETICEESWLD